MSDFLFNNDPSSAKSLAFILKTIIPESTLIEVQLYSGEWGALAVSSGPYNGFETYENQSFICVVIGGPVLYWRDNDFLTDKNQKTTATQAILERWLTGKADWSEDLSGPFTVFIVDKANKKLHCATDLMMFIPIYKYQVEENIVLGSHIDMVAKSAKQLDAIDEVSVADFVLHSYVTYPYTIYKNIYQLAPASIHTYRLENNQYSEQRKEYWLPLEKNPYESINEAASKLSTSLNHYIERVTSNMAEVAQFISAGEDSRSIAGMLPKRLKRHAHIYVDSKNREFKLAEHVAEAYSCDFHYILRSQTHYLDILPVASSIVGSGQQYTHAHTLGLVKESGADKHLAVFGGYASDSLLKAMHIQKAKYCSKFPFLPELELTNENRTNPVKSLFVKNNILLEIDKRRKAHMDYIQTLRPTSYHEWFMLWPYSMREAMPNLSINRRLFASYEVYTSKDVVKISAAVPTQWKLNRKLFHKAVKPALADSKWIQHADGRLPYFPWYVNSFLQLPRWSKRIPKKLFGSESKVNDGPWADWNQVLNNSTWNSIVEKLSKNANQFGFFNDNIELNTLFYSSKLTHMQKVNLIQTLYLKHILMSESNASLD